LAKEKVRPARGGVKKKGSNETEQIQGGSIWWGGGSLTSGGGKGGMGRRIQSAEHRSWLGNKKNIYKKVQGVSRGGGGQRTLVEKNNKHLLKVPHPKYVQKEEEEQLFDIVIPLRAGV